jgi:uncharacterized protein
LGRGLIAGAFWGIVVSALALAVAAVLIPLPQPEPDLPVAEAPLPEAPDLSAMPDVEAPAPPSPGADPFAVTPAAPDAAPDATPGPAPDPDSDTDAAAVADADPTRPDLAESEDAVPPVPEPDAGPSVASDPAADAVPDAAAPSGLAERSDEVAAEPAPAIVSDAELPRPEAGLDEPELGAVPADGNGVTARSPEPAPAAPQQAPAAVAEGEPGRAASPAEDAPGPAPEAPEPEAPAGPATADAPPGPLQPADETPRIAAPASTEPPDAEPAPPAVPPATVPERDEAAAAEVPDAAEATPEVAPDTVEPAPPPRVGFAPAAPGVEVDRLPRIGDDAPDAAAAPDDSAVAAADPAEARLPALRRNAVDFENPEARPLLAVILIDDGIDPEERAILAQLPFPVTFAVDPVRPDAGAVAQSYRDAGKEVVMLASAIPPGATASDLEVTFQSHFAAVPQAVAVIDLPEGGFQNNRLLAQQVVSILSVDGYGLVTFDRGLNAAEQVALSAGLGHSRVFRLLDAEDEDPAAIRRHLDRAVFRAAQEDVVIVVGSGREETVAGLLEWRMEGRADAVALAPVSAVLRLRQ